jgi:hypothetical protein
MEQQRLPSPPNLDQPIAIPSTSPSLGSPFLRAYPPSLAPYNLPAPVFLSFLDELNRLMVLSPPLRVLGLAGSIVSMVPLATAQIVGGAVNAAATVGQIGISKGMSAMFIREANEKIFAPRGLKVDLVKLEVVAKAAGIPILDAAGKVKKDTKLLPPMEDPGQDLSGQSRRLVAIAEYTSPLHVLPDEHKDVPDNFFNKMHTRASERQREKEERKVLKRRGKGCGKHRKDASKAQADYDKEMSKLDNEEAKVRQKEARKPKKLEDELRKIDREREKVQSEYWTEKGKAIKKDKEEAAVRKILWLLIQKKDAAAPQTQDLTELWNTSPQYGEHIERYRAERQAQSSPYIQDITQYPGTGAYLNNGPYQRQEEHVRPQSRMQYQVQPGYEQPPPYQGEMRY